MEESNDRQRVTWTARIAVKPSVKETARLLAKEDRVSVAHLIGNAIAEYVNARSS